MCRPSLVGACYTIQHVGCWELICDLYQSFVHQLWVGYTSAACGASVKVSIGIVCFPSHIPPPCWRTHDASLITLEGPFLPPWHSSLFPFLTLGRKLHHVLHMKSSLRVARTNLVYLSVPLFLAWSVSVYIMFGLFSRVLFMFSHQCLHVFVNADILT